MAIMTSDASAVRTVQRAIAQLQERARLRNTLQDKAARPTLTSKTGVGTRSADSSSGIDSPLTEQKSTRSYHAAVCELRSSDGLFVLQYKNINKVKMTDAKGFLVEFIYDDYRPS